MSPDEGRAGAGEREAAPRHDWASATTEKLEVLVSFIRDRTVTPVLRVVRYAIFGVLAAFVGVLLAVLVAVGLIRVLDSYLFHERVWASYLVVGGIFLAFGLLLLRMRYPRT